MKYERALQGSEETLGPMHPDTLASVYNLADLLENLVQVRWCVGVCRMTSTAMSIVRMSLSI